MSVRAGVQSITKFLTSPSRVAHALDWKKVSGAVLSLHIGKNSIDIAVTNHPTLDTCVQPLPSIPLKQEKTTGAKKNQKALHPSVVEELHDICDDWQVCGFVVSWPVQKEGGRCGAPCGRVLHTLDQLVAADAKSKVGVLNASRPVCLWDAHHVQAASEDEWGRSAVNARTSDKSIHYASVEQYQDDGAIAAEIAADYMRHHFPELNQHYADMLATANANGEDNQWGSAATPLVHTTAADASGKANQSSSSSLLQQQSLQQQQSQSQSQPQFDLAWLDAYEQTDAYCARAAL